MLHKIFLRIFCHFSPSIYWQHLDQKWNLKTVKNRKNKGIFTQNMQWIKKLLLLCIEKMFQKLQVAFSTDKSHSWIKTKLSISFYLISMGTENIHIEIPKNNI